MLTSDDEEIAAGNVIPAPDAAGVAFPTPIVEVAFGVVSVGDVEKTMLVLVVPVAPEALYPVMLLNAVIPAVPVPIPPRATANVPVQPKVKDAAASSAVLAEPPSVSVTLVSSVLVSAEPVTVMFGVVPPDEASGAEAVTEVTVPLPVPAPMAVRNVAASRVDTVLSAFTRKNVIALGLASVNRLEPTVVAPNEVRPVAATSPVLPPSHCFLSVYAVSQLVWLALVGNE